MMTQTTTVLVPMLVSVTTRMIGARFASVNANVTTFSSTPHLTVFDGE